jgi:hypothetical protein
VDLHTLSHECLGEEPFYKRLVNKKKNKKKFQQLFIFFSCRSQAAFFQKKFKPDNTHKGVKEKTGAETIWSIPVDRVWMKNVLRKEEV